MPRVKVEEALNEACPDCGKPLVIKTGRFGRFIACSGFPACRYTRRIVKATGAKCPECGGDLLERRGKKRGRVFYGCANFPTCKFLVNRRPLATLCPECSGLLVVSGRERAACTKCAWKGPVPKEEATPVEA
jgi:DNA topoisomerase-1